MGLDWVPLGKPKPGREAEFEALYEELTEEYERDVTLWERFSVVEITPYETLGAPRVGTDAEADSWAAEQYRNRRWKMLFTSRRKWMEIFNGYYALQLLPPNDGIPTYSNGGYGSYCEVFTFRGKFLEDCLDALGDELLGEAWEHHTARELMIYGTRIAERALSFAKEHRVTGVLGRRYRPDWLNDWDHPASQVHIVDSAARWCRYWGERGHGMIADF